MAIIRVKRSGGTGSPSALAQGEMAYSFLSGTQSNGGDRLYIGTGTETGGVAANIEVIGGKYFTAMLDHVPGTLTNSSAVIVDSSGKIDTFNATALTANTLVLTATLTANGSLGTAGQILTSNSTGGLYWSTFNGTTNIGQTADNSTITLTSSTGTGTTLLAANSTTAGLLSATSQTIAGAKTFSSTITGSITGNAGTATTLQTARNINGVSFNGSADITITSSTTNSLTFNNGGAGAASGSTFNGGSAVTVSYNTVGASPLAGSSSLTTTGTVTSGTWSASFGAVSGANLTNLTAGNLSGTIPSAVLGNSSLFVGTTSIALNRASGNLGLAGITSLAMPGSTSGTVTLTPAAIAGTTAITIPATTGTLITTGDTGTVTSTMIADGTIVNSDISASAAIAVSKLAASTISGVTLGSNLNTLTIGTGLSGTSYNGSAAVTIAIDSTVATLTGSQTLTNKTLTSPTINGGALSGTFTGSPLFSGTITSNNAVIVDTGASTYTDGFILRSGTITSGNPGLFIKKQGATDFRIISWNGTTNEGSLTLNFPDGVSTTDNMSVGGDLTVTGNVTINGTTTTVNSTTISVDDKNIELGSVATPTNTTADGGGITLKGATDKTLNWVNATGAWTSSEDFNLLSGKVYEINGTSVLSATTLGSGVTSSSLTSVGTITTGTWSASFGAVSGANLTNLTAGNLTGTIPSAVLSNSTAYVGTTAIALNRASANQGLTGITSLAMPGATSGTVTLTPAATAGTTAITIPATTGTLVTTGDTGTVTSTMIANGTIVDADINASAAIAVSKLAASTISGITLGNNLGTLTFGTGLTAGGASYNGSTGVTITAVTANNTALGVASFAVNDFTVTAGAVSINIVDGGTY